MPLILREGAQKKQTPNRGELYQTVESILASWLQRRYKAMHRFIVQLTKLRTYMRRLLPVVLTLVFSTMGCGGGNSSSASTPQILGNDSVTTIGGVYRLANITRVLKPNDSWSYRGTAKSNRTTRSVITTIGVANGPGSLLGFPAPLAVTATTAIEDGTSFGTTLYGYSDATSRELVVVGDKEGFLHGDLSALVGEWKLSLEHSGSGWRSETNIAYRFQLKVVGNDLIRVPAGAFETWRCEVQRDVYTLDAGRLFTQEGTFWYAPQLGQYVKAVYKHTPYKHTPSEGAEIEITEELFSASMLPTP